MTTTPGSRDEPLHYELRVAEQLHGRWASWFDGFSVAHGPDGTTTLSGEVADQAALHGVLRKLRDLGVTLLFVRVLDPRSGRRTQ